MAREIDKDKILNDDKSLGELQSRPSRCAEDIRRAINSIRNGDGGFSPPSLVSLRLGQEFLEVAEEISSSSDVIGVEPHTLELLVRALVYLDRELVRQRSACL